jgi:dTMP kinase
MSVMSATNATNDPHDDAPTAARGRWITFEGVEGCGKSYQLDRLAARLAAAGRDVLTTREPGGTELGRELRALLLRPGLAIDPAVELMLYVGDRAQHLGEVVLPALERGRTVLCDRYLDATLAYQGYGRGIDLAWIRALHAQPPLDRRPHRTVLLDMDSATALARARGRNARLGLDRSEGRFEAERLEFHDRVRRGYLELAAAEPERFRVVDAGGDRDAVAARVDDAVDDLVGAPR